MGTTKEDIREWIRRGKEQKATHLIVVCDTFDYNDYPVFVQKNEDVKIIVEEYSGRNMQTIMEVYNLNKNIEDQLNSDRCYNL